MSILIKGMKMPFVGSIKTIVIYPDGTVRTRRQDPLPYTAVPVPPHGRLIDADALKSDDEFFIGKMMMFGGREIYSQSTIDSMPTIIPADPAEEGE